jgi:hypothetical protein
VAQHEAAAIRETEDARRLLAQVQKFLGPVQDAVLKFHLQGGTDPSERAALDAVGLYIDWQTTELVPIARQGNLETVNVVTATVNVPGCHPVDVRIEREQLPLPGLNGPASDTAPGPWQVAGGWVARPRNSARAESYADLAVALAVAADAWAAEHDSAPAEPLTDSNGVPL